MSKTTIAGILTATVAVLGGIITYLNTSHLPDFTPIIVAITAAVGLFHAADAPKP